MGGNETDLLHILQDSHTPNKNRSDALRALTRFPQLSTTTQVVLASLQDIDADVRKNAALVVAHFSIAAAGPLIRKLLTDTDPVVRESALSALVKLPDVPWSVVRQMLQDADEKVVESARCALHKAQTIP